MSEYDKLTDADKVEVWREALQIAHAENAELRSKVESVTKELDEQTDAVRVFLRVILDKPSASAVATMVAWTCPKCGAAHPITVPTCCGPTPLATPNVPAVPKRRNPFGTPFQPGIIPEYPTPTGGV